MQFFTELTKIETVESDLTVSTINNQQKVLQIDIEAGHDSWGHSAELSINQVKHLVNVLNQWLVENE